MSPIAGGPMPAVRARRGKPAQAGTRQPFRYCTHASRCGLVRAGNSTEGPAHLCAAKGAPSALRAGCATTMRGDATSIHVLPYPRTPHNRPYLKPPPNPLLPHLPHKAHQTQATRSPKTHRAPRRNHGPTTRRRPPDPPA